MGLWPADTSLSSPMPFGAAESDRKVGALVPTNLNAALPGSAEKNFGLDEGCRFMLSEFFYTHVFCEGKLVCSAASCGSTGLDTNVFANNHRNQFMNTALAQQHHDSGLPAYTTMGVGVVLNPTDWLSVLTAVADSDGRAKTTV